MRYWGNKCYFAVGRDIDTLLGGRLQVQQFTAEWKLQDAGVDPMIQAKSWSFTRIFQQQMDFHALFIINFDINQSILVTIYIDVRPQFLLGGILTGFYTAIRSIGGFLSGVGSLFGVSEAFADVSQLVPKEDKLKAPDNYQEASKQRLQSSIESQPPIFRRFCIALFSIFCSLLGSIFGWNALYDKRHFLGAALILGSWLLSGGGFLLYWLILFPTTWRWIV